MMLERVNQSPDNLDALCSSIWNRANIDHDVYGKTSASYLNLIVEDHGLWHSNNVFQMWVNLGL